MKIQIKFPFLAEITRISLGFFEIYFDYGVLVNNGAINLEILGYNSENSEENEKFEVQKENLLGE